MPDDPPTIPAAPSPGPDDAPTVRLTSDEFSPPLIWAPGQKALGRFTLEALVGRGGMGVVWRARDEVLGETVALKFLPESIARDEAAVDELKEETRRARRLTHPNIVRIHDFVQGAGLAAISMEFIDGETLARRRLDQPGKVFSTATLGPLAAQLCAALDYAHTEAKVAHRDLKPANMLVTRDGQLKVADFGIARGLTETNTRLTGRAGRTSGTLLYASPQQLSGDTPSATDDIYALGASLYEMLTGKPPFYRGDASSLIMQVRDKAPLPLAAQRAELELTGEPIPAKWEKTILACLAKDPKNRPQSAGEVAVRLGLAASPSPGAKKKSWRPLVAAGAVAVAGILAYVWWPKPVTAVAAPVSPNVAVLPREFVVTIDPPGAAAQLSLGPQAGVEAKAGRAVFKDLPDGEHELLVKAAGYQSYGARVRVKNGRGSAEARLVVARGTLEVKARPGTAITLTDERGGEARTGKADAAGLLRLENLPVAGRYTLRLEHPDCVPVDQKGVELDADRVTTLAPGQVSTPGEIRVFSVPAGAAVTVNGRAAGNTPATLKDQPSELLLQIEVAAPGYRKNEQSLTLRPGEVRTLNVGTLVATGGAIVLRVALADFDPARAQVLVDGRAVRPVPAGDAWQIEGLEPGNRVVEIAYPDCEPWKSTVPVQDRETAEVAVPLVANPATLTLAVTGPAAYVLLANGYQVAVAGGKATLPADQPVKLEVRAQGFKSAVRTLTPKRGGAESWQVTLETPVLPRPNQPWENSLGMKFVPVPGTGVLFSIWDTRVQDFAAFVNETHNSWQKPPYEQGPTHPVVRVSWNDAVAYCAWLTEKERLQERLGPNQRYRLPTDSEWSTAAGLSGEPGVTPADKDGKVKNVYPWGTEWPPPKGAGNFADESIKRRKDNVDPRLLNSVIAGYDDGFAWSSPVGSFAANRFGLYDMAGNVYQLVEDEYRPGTGIRVMRGGSFNHGAYSLLSSARNSGTGVMQSASSDTKHNALGFRCVLEITGVATPAASVVTGTDPGVTPAAGAKTAFENSLGMKFVPVPGVEVLFSVWDTRVQDFAAFVRATGYQVAAGMTSLRKGTMGSYGDTWQSPGFVQGPTHPVVGVDAAGVKAFCAWLTMQELAAGRIASNQEYRLPTNDEWSKAAGPGEFQWGDQWPPPRGAGNFAGTEARDVEWAPGWSTLTGYNDGFARTSPVGSFAANRDGLFDMNGNVWQRMEDGGCRGGAFDIRGRNNLATAARLAHDTPSYSLGFRCVLATVAPADSTAR